MNRIAEQNGRRRRQKKQQRNASKITFLLSGFNAWLVFNTCLFSIFHANAITFSAENFVSNSNQHNLFSMHITERQSERERGESATGLYVEKENRILYG